jgi:Na+/melibiose symporter-like transporter
MFRVVIRSRIGNGVLAFLGVVYFFSATATLVYYIVSNWGANGIVDYVLQFALFCAAIGGVLFFMIGYGNLKSKKTTAPQSRAPLGSDPVPSHQ